MKPKSLNTTLSVIRRLSKVGVTYLGARFTWVVVATIVATALPMALPQLFGMAIDRILAGTAIADLALLLISMALIAVVAALISMVSSQAGINLGYQAAQNLTLRLYGALMTMPYLTYLTINQGVLTSRLTNDVRMIEPFLVDVPLTAIRGWTMMAVTGVALAWINPWFLLAFLVVPGSLTLVRYAEGRIDATIKASFEVNANVTTSIETTTTADAISLVRQTQSTTAEVQGFDAVLKGAADIATTLDFWRANVRLAYDTSFALISVAMLALGAALAQSGYSSIGGVVSALLYVGQLRSPLRELIGLRYPILRASVGLQRAEDVLNSPNTGVDRITLPAAPRVSERISPAVNDADAQEPVLRFENVSFQYPEAGAIGVQGLSQVDGARPSLGFAAGISFTELQASTSGDSGGAKPLVLDRLTFTVPKGKIVAVAGTSGSGKSTIVGLACGFFRPISGSVILNGRNSAQMAEEEIWGDVALVSQDIYLRPGTLRDNLSRGLRSIEDDEIVEACHLAGLEGLLSELPEGLETRVGNRGKRFSGGERQRISIARALLKKSQLLVLDEATSSLDSAQEAAVLEAIDSIRGDKAVLVVAHRPAAVARSDLILMIENGSAVEWGTHSQLICANGPYAAMHLQSR